MGEFPAAEHDGDLDLVLVLEKADSLLDLEFNVVLASLWSNTDFLESRLMGLVLVGFLVPFIAELAVVHNTADRRFGFRGDFHKIKSGFTRLVECLACCNYSQLLSLCINYPNR